MPEASGWSNFFDWVGIGADAYGAFSKKPSNTGDEKEIGPKPDDPKEQDAWYEKVGKALGVGAQFIKDNPWLADVISQGVFQLTTDKPEINWEKLKQSQIDTAVMGSPDLFNQFGSSRSSVDPKTGKVTNVAQMAPWMTSLAEAMATRLGQPINTYQSPAAFDEMLGGLIKTRETNMGLPNSGEKGWQRPFDPRVGPDVKFPTNELPEYPNGGVNGDGTVVDPGDTIGSIGRGQGTMEINDNQSREPYWPLDYQNLFDEYNALHPDDQAKFRNELGVDEITSEEQLARGLKKTDAAKYLGWASKGLNFFGAPLWGLVAKIAAYFTNRSGEEDIGAGYKGPVPKIETNVSPYRPGRLIQDENGNWVWEHREGDKWSATDNLDPWNSPTSGNYFDDPWGWGGGFGGGGSGVVTMEEWLHNP